ncbi:MAG TPA: triose-phosphate isomerase [Atribacteraceae bacterium]|nr:triose-phosphate isomerase [Atribacteraceae bacterium]
MSRIPITAGNWKMHKTTEEASAFAEALLSDLPVRAGGAMEIIICPPFTSLGSLQQKVYGTPVKLGAQNMHGENWGAFTGEISPAMLVDVGCTYVILGHSERRHIFGEKSADIGRKVAAALAHDLRPILCVGETIEEREAKRTESVIKGQLAAGIAGVTEDKAETLVIAYEPVWAIGTGRAAAPADARQVIEFIRRELAGAWNVKTSERCRILYGGSVKGENVFEFVQDKDIDGTLVGGASLDAGQFLAIVEETLKAYR